VPQRVSHEVRTIHPVLEASSAKVEGPYHRHPVRQHEVEPGKGAGEFGAMTGLAKDVGIGRTDRSRSWLTRECLDPLQRGVVRGARNAGPQDSDGWQRSFGCVCTAGPRGRETVAHWLTAHKCHGVNILVPAAVDKSRYWGQGQQTTASPTPGLALNASQSEICSNS